MTAIPVRFAIFGALCTAWTAAMTLSSAPSVDAAGTAWFVNWAIQISVTLLSWGHRLALPDGYYRPWRAGGLARSPRRYGLSIFEAAVRRINPLPVDRRSFRTLDDAMRAAETTHAITFGIGCVVTVGLIAGGSTATAAFLAIWNVIFNAYAIALQRHNRARIQRLARRRTSERRSADPRLRDHRSAAASSSP